MSSLGKRRHLFASLAVLLAAGILRLWASLDDLWLDEIWSWGHVQVRVKSAWDVLFALKHDNNHILNSWWIYVLGPDADRVWYRLPPVVFGSLTVLLARQVVVKSGPIAVWLVTFLTLPSYLLIHYSSEARGYGYEMFFCLAAFVLLDRILGEGRSETPVDGKRRLIDRALFAAACLGGALSHPAFLMLFVSLGLWAAWVKVRQRTTWGARVRWRLGVFAAPVALVGLLWLINYSRLEIGGGPPQIASDVALSTLSLMVGGPEAGDASLWIGLFVAFAVIVQLIHMARTGDDRWVCAAAIIAVPAVLLIMTGNRQIYPRYLLGTAIVLLPMLALLLARCFKHGAAGRAVTMVVIAVSLLGQSWQLSRLFQLGRGQAQDVVEYLRDHSADGPILVGSDHTFRHGLVLDYFARRLGLQDRLVYFGEPPWPPGGPRWFLVHSQHHVWDPPPPPSFTGPQGQRYELRRVFPYAGLSGWHTAIFENVKSSERGASAP